MSLEAIHQNAQQLAKSETGRNALRHLLAWLDEDGLLLDGQNKEAAAELLVSAWGGYAMTTRDAMREALGRTHIKPKRRQ